MYLCQACRTSCTRRIIRSNPNSSTKNLIRTFTNTPPSRAEQVRLVEVGPRDGLQNEKKSIPLGTKIQMIRRLAASGLHTIEAGSFVSPKWVPQMANSSKILESILSNPPPSEKPVTYQWLLPNMKGLEEFLKTFDKYAIDGTGENTNPKDLDSAPALNTSSYDANAMPSHTSGTSAMSSSTSPETDPSQPQRQHEPTHEISLFTAATDTFSLRNTNKTVSESLDLFSNLIARSKLHASSPRVRAYISVALGCPFDGADAVSPHEVARITSSLLEMGADEVCIADTTGFGTAPKTRALLKTLKSAGIRMDDLALHIHDTYGQALVNVIVGLEEGVRVFDASVAGLGGCPFSPGATGNVATEDLLHLFGSLGLAVEGAPRLDEVSRVGEWISAGVGRPNESRAGRATLARL